MKIFLILFFVFPAATLVAQQNPKRPNSSLKWSPAGLIFGNIGLQGEYNFGKNSLTAKIGIPVSKHHTFEYDGSDAHFNLKSTSFMAGYRTYLSKDLQHMKGLYFEPYFKYVHLSGEGTGKSTLGNDMVTMNFTNDYNALGVGAELGVQFLVRKRMVIDLYFLGPEINSASNNLKAVEASSAVPWTSMQAAEAKQDITDFIDKFPFIRNHVDVMVDPNNKTVKANFKGALPGYRIGVSFGYTF